VGVGSLVGYFDGGTISRSFANGSVTVGQAIGVGGLVGKSWADISNSYSQANVTVGPDSYSVGGTIGESFDGDVINTFSVGKVTAGTGSLYVGGFAGRYIGGKATACFWDKTTSGQASSVLGIGRSTSQMHSTASYPHWNFSSIWYKPTLTTYPRLRGLALPITWQVADVTIRHGTLPKAGAVTLRGVLAVDAAKVKGVVTVYDSAGQAVTLSATTPVGVYSEKVTKLTGEAASTYVLTGVGNHEGMLKVQ
jgi:hypothetical protein